MEENSAEVPESPETKDKKVYDISTLTRLLKKDFVFVTVSHRAQITFISHGIHTFPPLIFILL